MKAKQQRRASILAKIERKRKMIETLQKASRSLAEGLVEQWVVRRTILACRSSANVYRAPEGSESYYGHRNPGTVWLVEGFIFDSPHEEGVRVFKTPDSAQLYAQCAADRDSSFDRQEWYKIEVVDRVDGEVFCEIPCRSEYIKAIKRGASLTEAAKLL